MKNYRHGDMALIGIEKIPADAIKTTEKVLMIGSGGNSHCFDKGIFYKSSSYNFVVGYLEAKNTKLLHPDHGEKINGQPLRVAKIDNGTYEVRKQFEDTHEGMKPVID